MSEKEKEGPKDPVGTEPAQPATRSIAPAMDLSFEAVTVPPPPKSGAASSGGGFSIPKAPALPKESRPGGVPSSAKKKRSEDDIFSIFDVESNAASDDIPVSVQQFDPLPQEKPKTQLGGRFEPKSGEREVSRNRQIPIDQDLFNLSVGLFSSPAQAPLVAPDMSALTAPGLSEKAPAKSALPDLELPVAPIAPLAPIDPSALTSAPGQTPAAPSKPGKTGFFVGIAAVVVLAAGTFFFVTRKDTPPAEQGTTAQNATPAAAANNLDTLPQRPAADEPRAAARATTDAPKDEPASLAKVAQTNPGESPKEGAVKPAAKSGDSGGQAKPSEPEAPVKPAEPPPPSGADKAQSLAAAMAAGAAAPPPPPSSGPEFNKSAAASALNSAASSAVGCKAPGDPSGVARVSVTFAPTGRATRAQVNGPPFGGTPTGGCIAAKFRSVSVPAFSGDPVTVSRSVTIR